MIPLTSIPEFGKGKGELKFLNHYSRGDSKQKILIENIKII